MHTKPSLEAELLDLKQRTKDLEVFMRGDECQKLPRISQQLYSEMLRVQLRLEQCVAAILRQYDNPLTH